ncbi:DUF397 domain-containing protein [Streptomyces sp. NPDC001450]
MARRRFPEASARLRAAWRSSDHEAHPDISIAVWRKPSYSDGGANNCVEAAGGCAGLVSAGDSEVPDGRCSCSVRPRWAVFLAEARNGLPVDG